MSSLIGCKLTARLQLRLQLQLQLQLRFADDSNISAYADTKIVHFARLSCRNVAKMVKIAEDFTNDF